MPLVLTFIVPRDANLTLTVDTRLQRATGFVPRAAILSVTVQILPKFALKSMILCVVVTETRMAIHAKHVLTDLEQVSLEELALHLHNTVAPM